MEKKLTLKLASAALMIGALASCNEELEIVAGTSTEASGKEKLEQKIEEYSANFVKRYGTPDPDQDYGMAEVLMPIERSYDAGTRASGAASGSTDKGVDVRRNMWVLGFTDNNNAGVFNTDQAGVIGKDIKIPGWPNDDKLFYVSNGGGVLQNIAYQKDADTHQNYVIELANGHQPVGDVTDYEIQYVSTWFRTHKNIKSLPLHLTDFFIQNISVDHDQLTYDYAVDCGNTIIDPTSAFNSLPCSVGANGVNINKAKDATGENSDHGLTVTRYQNSNEDLNYALDYLHFRTVDGEDEVGAGWTHVNNFNNQNSNFNPESNTTNNNREIKYVTSSGTEGFACRASQATDDGWVKDYVLVHLSWKEVMADGQEHIREGYYLGFDYSMTKRETKVERDGFYSNWIVKITPGHFTSTSNARRVMCEDLGSTFDFDFNDVVYDIAIENDNGTYNAIISLQAAGGTLPIWVGYGDDFVSGNNKSYYEAHHLLGQDYKDGETYQPVNDVMGGLSHSVAIYRIKNVPSTLSLYDIKIYVDQMDGNGPVKIAVGENGGLGGDQNMSAEDYGVPNSNPGLLAPRRFAVPVGTQWMQECKFIENAYPKFKDWVQKKSNTYEWGGETGKNWYECTDQTGLLYSKSVSASGSAGSATEVSGIQTLTPYTVENKWNPLPQACLKINGYDNVATAIAGMLTTGGKTAVTFTIVYKVAESSNVVPKGRMIPVDIVDGNLCYSKSHDTNLSGVTMTFVESVYQASYQDAQGRKTYVNRLSFTKEQLMSEGDQKLCDYIMLYLENGGEGIEVAEMYAHY